MEEQIREEYAKASGQIEEMIQRLNVSAAFGEPTRQGDVTLIPVATVGYVFGSGQGWGRGSQEPGVEAAAPDAEVKTGEGGGGGGGGGGRSRPIGYIRIDQNGAAWEPLVDPTKLGVAGMLLAGWVAFWVMKTLRTFVEKG